MFKALKTWLAASAAVMVSGTAAAEEGVPLYKLPLTVQAYVFPMAVAYENDPWSVTAHSMQFEGVTFEPPYFVNGSPGGDLDSDGTPDYAVNLCMFNARGFWTNGNPCSAGRLVLSSSSSVDIRGLVLDSVPFNEPYGSRILVRESRPTECGESSAACDVVNRVWAGRLDEIEVCAIGECKELRPNRDLRSLNGAPDALILR